MVIAGRCPHSASADGGGNVSDVNAYLMLCLAVFKVAIKIRFISRLSAWLDEIVLALTVDTQKLYSGCFIREYSEVEFVCDG